MLTHRQLQYFVAVAEELHFSRAADRLGVAQSAVSVQVQQLEQQLGVRLILRNKRQPIALTDAGAMLYAEAVAALRHIERAEQVGLLAARGLSGNIRMGYVASAVTSGLLSRLLGDFRASHAQVRMQVIAMETPKQLNAIDTGEIDVGLVRPRRQYPDGVEALIVHSEAFMVAMPESHALARQVAVQSSDLKGQTFIAPQFNESEGFSEVLARLASAAGFPVTAEYHVNDFITATSLAAAGYGVVIVPESIRLFGQPGVAFRPISDFHELGHLALAYRKREHSPAIRSFVAAARALRPE